MYQVVIYINEQPLTSEPYDTIEQAIEQSKQIQEALKAGIFSVEVVS